MRMRSVWAFLAVGCMTVLLTSCSGGSRSDEIVAEESIYSPGASVSAVGFGEACSFRFFLGDENGGFSPLGDGDYVEPGSRKFAVQIEGGVPEVGRVFVSDGAAYQVEAVPQDGRYICEFTVSEESLYQVVLIQAIHPNGRASKEKIVLRTTPPVPAGSYAKNAVGVLAAQELLDLQRGDLAALLDGRMQEAFASIRENCPSFITELKFGDDDPYTADVAVHSIEAAHFDAAPSAVLRTRFTIRDVTLAALPLYGQTFLSTSSNDLLVDAYVAIDDTGADGGVRLVLDLVNSAVVSFSQPFFLQSVLERLIASEIGLIELPPLSLDLAGGTCDPANLLPEDVRLFGSGVDVHALVEGFDLDRVVFADVYGVPEATTHEMLALGLGLCSQASKDVLWDSPDEGFSPSPIDMEQVFGGLIEAAISGVFENIRQEYEGLVTNLAYGDGNPETDDYTVGSLALGSTGDPDAKTARISLTVRQVDLEAMDLFGFALISTQDNDLEIDATFTIEHREDGTGRWIVLDTQSVERVHFTEDLNPPLLCRPLVEAMIEKDLEEMDARSCDVDEMLAGFEIGLGSGSVFAPGPFAAFPGLSPLVQDPGWTLDLPDTSTLSLTVSQAAVNRLVAGIAGPGTELDVDNLLVRLLGEEFPGFANGRSLDERTVMRLSVPPAVDLRDSRIRLSVPDIVFQYRVADIPQWEASVDVCLIVTPFANGSTLDIGLSCVSGGNRFHVMKDNPGNLGLFDHSSLADDVLGSLPELLGGSPDAAFLSFSLDSWEPSLVFDDRDEPVTMTAGDGYLSVDMAVSGIDFFQ